MIVVIDNYDSFVYNLVQYIGEFKRKIKVYRNDKVTVEEIESIRPERIIISPGPGRPENAGISNEVIKEFGKRIPILGVCLGHQCIGYVFGCKIINAKRLMHGKTSLIHHNEKDIYKNITNPFEATRYHSLAIDKESVPDILEINALSDDGEIMGIKHKKYKIFGVQFHPESILTKEGKKLLKNFLEI